jgi:hypothetical protein
MKGYWEWVFLGGDNLTIKKKNLNDYQNRNVPLKEMRAWFEGSDASQQAEWRRL